jgi:hypothetical protein
MAERRSLQTDSRGASVPITGRRLVTGETLSHYQLLEISERYGTHARAPEALFRMARDTLQSRRPGKESEARKLFSDVRDRYPNSPWAVRALMAQGEIEERQNFTWSVSRISESFTLPCGRLQDYPAILTERSHGEG